MGKFSEINRTELPADEIPDNVTAQIVPKTLFGEKYVELTVPSDPSAEPLQAGATIKQTEMPVEVERVVNKLRTQKGIVIDYDLVEGATHFWQDNMADVESHVSAYLDKKRAALGAGADRRATERAEAEAARDALANG